MMAVRNTNYILQRNGGSKKELLRSEDYARKQINVPGVDESNPVSLHPKSNTAMSTEYYNRKKGTTSKTANIDSP